MRPSRIGECIDPSRNFVNYATELVACHPLLCWHACGVDVANDGRMGNAAAACRYRHHWGGVIGCSIAYHLAKAGKVSVVVLEQFRLTSGSTWHAAGVVGQLRPTLNLTRMLQESVRIYDELTKETGSGTGWQKVGSLRIASSKDRMFEFRRLATTARSFGLEMQLLTPREALDLFPIMDLDGVEGAAYVASDGIADPSGLTQAFAASARKRGVTFIEQCKFTGCTVDGRRITGIETDQGTIKADVVVNAAGIWAHDVGKKMGCRVPAFAVEHQYCITDPIPDLPEGMPPVRDPDYRTYWKPEFKRLAVGGWEPDTIAFGRDSIPEGWDHQLIQENFERFGLLADNAAMRTPILKRVGIRSMINGAIPISADGDFVMGRVAERDNVFVCSGFVYGIAGAGGAGAAMAQWILEGRPERDLWPLDVQRFQFHHNTKYFMFDRAVEIYGNHYTIKWPGQEHQTVRGIRHSPLYGLLKERRAVFGSKAGWERPNWFAPEDVVAIDEPSFGRPNWFHPVGEEHRAVRERVALIDQSSFAKMAVVGPGTLSALQRLVTANLDRPVGSVVYTQMCNEAGGIIADLTFSRVAEEEFYVVTGTALGEHDFGWIKSHLPAQREGIATFDLTSAYAVINLCGPKSRDVLAKAAEEPVDNAHFGFAQLRSLTVGAAPVRAMRVSFTGELGYELHIPSEYAMHVYQLLWEIGREFGIANVGYRALNSLRMEKGYLVWSQDISPDYSPYEAGLDKLISWKKGDFLGRAALEDIAARGVDRRLCMWALQSDVSVHGGEAILREGKVLGVTTSGNFGYTVGQPLVFGYVPADSANFDRYEVEVAGQQVAAVRSDWPFFDPDGFRFRA